MGESQSYHGPGVGESLSRENLARRFGGKSEITRHGVAALYEALGTTRQPATAAARQQWKKLVGVACGYDFERPSGDMEKLAKNYGIAAAGLQPDALLFALHTYYATVVKLLAGQVVAPSYRLSSPAERLLEAGGGDRLRQETEQLAGGGFFRELNVDDLFRDDPFSWYPAEWSGPIERLIRQLAAAMAQFDARIATGSPAVGNDLLGQLYQELFPRPLRHKLGEYYTPDWLVEHVLEAVGYTGQPGRRLLDPACGSGTFLLAAIRRLRARHETSGEPSELDQGELCRRILQNVAGYDLNPLAVMTARANCLIALGDLLPHAGRVEIPVRQCDSILDASPLTDRQQPFDYVVGNPPWIAWDNLPDDYRQATKPLWEQYGLFSLSGNEGRHGGGKKDLSMLMAYTAADRYLDDGGRLAMVITQTLFQSKGAGDGFRRFRLGPDGAWLKVLRVDDMVAVRPFPDATNFTSVIVLEKGSPTQYPVPYVKWSPGDGDFRRRPYRAEPIDPSRPGSPWFLRPEGLETELARLVGPSDYVARLGANSGGANGVYWVNVLGETADGVLVRNIAEKSKRGVERVEHVVEPDLLYPLIRWGDVGRFRARPSAHLLLTQDVESRTGIDEDVMRRQYPRTYAYLQRFAGVLTARSAYRRYQRGKAFYSMYNVGTYTVAPIKVVWRRMDRRLRAAVVRPVDDLVLGPRAVVPQETCVLIACETEAEAHYVCAVLNSALVNFLVTAHSVCGGKGFGTPSMLDFVKLRRFDPQDPRHADLSACSRQAHLAAARGREFSEIQSRIDRLAGELWGLSAEELLAIEGA